MSKHHLRTALLLSGALLMTSCVHEEKDAKPTDPGVANPMENTDPAMMGRNMDPNAINYNVSTEEELANIDNGSDEELIWTNPDDPNADIPELTAAFESRKKGGGWQHNLNQALAFSRAQEKPTLIWFHDSVISPKSKTLGKELLETKAFSKWCEDNVIRVMLDSGASIRDDAGQGRAPIYSMAQVNSIHRRMGLRSKPALVVIAPHGKITARVDGYDGYAHVAQEIIETGVAEANRMYEEHKDKLRDKGYRDWSLRKKGQKLFAKLQRYDEKKEMVYLLQPGGKVRRLSLSRFAMSDVEYLDEYARNKAAGKR